MADNKKDDDLTRIEDLGEYIHELNEKEEDSDFEAQEDTSEDFERDMLDAPTDPNISLPDELYQDDSFDSTESFSDDYEASEDNSFGAEEENSFEMTSDSNIEPEESADEFTNEFQNDEFQSGDFQEEDIFAEELDNGPEDILEEELPSDSLEESSNSEFEELEFEAETIKEPQTETFEPEMVLEKTPLERVEEEKRTLVVEDLSEVKNFAMSGHYSNFAAEGNPPFSIIIKDIHYLEDIKEIIHELQSLKLITEDDAPRAQESFMRGSFLISRISEFAAIMLCHKLRRFNVTTLMGLSSEIHPSSADEFTTPIVSKYSVYQNRQESLSLEEKISDLNHIVTSTTGTLEGYHILKYIDIISEHLIIDIDDFEKSFRLKEEIGENLSHYKERDKLQTSSIKEMNIEALGSKRPSKENLLEAKAGHSLPEVGLNDFYRTLTQKLKTQAMKLNANGIVGINFMINPLIKEDLYKRPRYQISATGNAVWAKPL